MCSQHSTGPYTLPFWSDAEGKTSSKSLSFFTVSKTDCCMRWVFPLSLWNYLQYDLKRQIDLSFFLSKYIAQIVVSFFLVRVL